MEQESDKWFKAKETDTQRRQRSQLCLDAGDPLASCKPKGRVSAFGKNSPLYNATLSPSDTCVFMAMQRPRGRGILQMNMATDNCVLLCFYPQARNNRALYHTGCWRERQAFPDPNIIRHSQALAITLASHQFVQFLCQIQI